MMKEFVTANGITYECESVTTGLNSISFATTGRTANELMQEFEDVSEITVSFADSEPHGIYKNLKLESVATMAEGDIVVVTMRIKSEIEIRLDRLEEGQEIQNGAIDELAAMQGGEK